MNLYKFSEEVNKIEDLFKDNTINILDRILSINIEYGNIIDCIDLNDTINIDNLKIILSDYIFYVVKLGISIDYDFNQNIQLDYYFNYRWKSIMFPTLSIVNEQIRDELIGHGLDKKFLNTFCTNLIKVFHSICHVFMIDENEILKITN